MIYYLYIGLQYLSIQFYSINIYITNFILGPRISLMPTDYNYQFITDNFGLLAFFQWSGRIYMF